MGLTINLIWDSSVNSDPDVAGFKAAVAAGAQYVDNLISNPITVNIQVGWKEANGIPLTPDEGGGALYSPLRLTYAQLRNDLIAAYGLSGSAADSTALNNLPLVDPTNGGFFAISPAQEKAWGLLPSNSTSVDGSVGFNFGTSADYTTYIGLIEHELTHALGRLAFTPGTFPAEIDLFRYVSPGILATSNSQLAYFSIDDGVTGQNFPYDINFDPGDWASSVYNDPFSISGTGYLSFTDITVLNVMGFNLTHTANLANPVGVQNVTVAENGPIGASSLITSVSNPSGDAITQFGFRDDGGGGGYFTLNGTAQPDGQWIIVNASNLNTVQYVGASSPGSETIKVEAYDATAATWLAFSSLTATSTAALVPTTLNVKNIAVPENTSIAASSMIASIVNSSNDNITMYGFNDEGSSFILPATASGYLALNGVPIPSHQIVFVSASNISNLTYVGGGTAGNDILFVEIYDATTKTYISGEIGAYTTGMSIFQTQLSAAFAGVLQVNSTSVLANTSTITLADGSNVPNPLYQDANTLGELASQVTGNQIPIAQALNTIEHYGDTTTSVATLSYQFFTGATPSAAGYAFLINSATNPNDLNDPYYAKFNEENRYINFAVNLGKLGAGAASFNAAYGSLDLAGAMTQAYTAIFGFAPAAGKISAILTASVGSNETRADYFAAYGLDGPNGIGTKAAAVGWLMAVAVESDTGTYAQANDQFLAALANGTAQYNVNLLTAYAPAPAVGLVGAAADMAMGHGLT